MNPEFYDFIIEKLFTAGALDVYLTPIQMKKNRPAQKLTVLGKAGNIKQLTDIILKETSSIGLRIIENVRRICLEREIRQVATPWGDVKIKLSFKDKELTNIAPEYEDCKMIARKEDVSLKVVYQTALKNILLKQDS